MKRDFLMKGHPAKGNEDIGGWYFSEKVDGIRAFWDGGVSRGHDICSVPWANINKLKEGQVKLSTGLWSYYGNPIYAPDWFLNDLPCCPLDGELWAGRGKFQTTSSIVRKLKPLDSEWEQISYSVFSCPQLRQVFRDGEITNRMFEKTIELSECLDFIDVYCSEDYVSLYMDTGADVTFHEEISFLEEALEFANHSVLELHNQIVLPKDSSAAWEVVNNKLEEIYKQGGEGGIIRDPSKPWIPKRVRSVLKVKPKLDAEAIVVGATSGKGKYLGMIGNFIVVFRDIVFELSGFTDQERKIHSLPLQQWATDNPGKEIPVSYLTDGSTEFNLGTRMTFTYRELSRDGVPKEARYLRVRPDEH